MGTFGFSRSLGLGWGLGSGLAALWMLVCAVGLVVAVGCGEARGDDDEPAKSVFFSGSYEEARSAATGDRVLVLYFTATWCGPCKQMERTTWVDGKVVELLTTKGVVFKIDVDEQRELSRKYGVRAMPTMIAMKDGEVFDRVVGGRNPEQMIEWFEGVRRGERSIDAQRRRVEQRARPGDHDVQARFELARSLMEVQSYEEAMEHLVWLWDHSLEHMPSFAGVRVSFMLSTIEELCGVHPPARAAFAERRDGVERRLAEGAMNPQLASDFAALNEALGEPERTLAWFDANKDDASKGVLFEMASVRLMPLLLEHERWADAGRMIQQPVERAQISIPMEARMYQGMDQLGEEMKRHMLGELAKRHAIEHAALLAAGRESEGVRMAMLMVNHLGDSARVELARTALRAKTVRPLHLRMLSAVELDQPADFVELRTKLEAALAERGE